MNIEDLLIEKCKEKGIDVIIESIDFFEKVRFTFTKGDKRFCETVPTREFLEITLKETWVSQMIRKAEKALDH